MEFMRGIGFQKAWSRLTLAQTRICRPELYKALGIKNRQSFREYRVGNRECRPTQIANIEKVFAKYGINSDEVWDN